MAHAGGQDGRRELAQDTCQAGEVDLPWPHNSVDGLAGEHRYQQGGHHDGCRQEQGCHEGEPVWGEEGEHAAQRGCAGRLPL